MHLFCRLLLQIAHACHRFVHQYDEEYEQQRKTRRPGRPASAREDLLKVTIKGLETEYEKGFCGSPSAVLSCGYC